MDGSQVLWLIIAIIVVLVIIGLVAAMMGKRKTEQRRTHASELREDVTARGRDVHDQELQARESQASADRARAEAQQKQAEAERLQAEADQEHTGHAQERAMQEDRLRTADRVDPDVDHRERWEESESTTGSETGADAAESSDPDGTHRRP